MFLAPTPTLSGVIVALAPGMDGVRQTLASMRAMVNTYRTNLALRQQAISLIFTTPQRDELGEVTCIFDFVRDHIRYVRDINDVETLSTPDKTAAARIGDCDDKTVLLATLLESVGYPTRFVVAGYSNPGDVEHVYLQVFAVGEWIDADTTETQPLGYAPPNPVTVLIEGT